MDFTGGTLRGVEVVAKALHKFTHRRDPKVVFRNIRRGIINAFEKANRKVPSEAYINHLALEQFNYGISTSEINPYTGEGRVVGLEDANWIIDAGVAIVPGLMRGAGRLAGSKFIGSFGNGAANGGGRGLILQRKLFHKLYLKVQKM